MFFQLGSGIGSSVDLPDPDGPQITIRSPLLHRQVDIPQDMETAIPFIDSLHGDHHLISNCRA